MLVLFVCLLVDMSLCPQRCLLLFVCELVWSCVYWVVCVCAFVCLFAYLLACSPFWSVVFLFFFCVVGLVVCVFLFVLFRVHVVV